MGGGRGGGGGGSGGGGGRGRRARGDVFAPNHDQGQKRNKLKSFASTCLVANKLDQVIEGIQGLAKITRQVKDAKTDRKD